MASKLPLPRRSPKLDPSLKLSASTAKEMVTGSGTTPKYLAYKKDGKVNRSLFDIHFIDVYFTRARSSTWVFDTGSVAMISKSKQELRNKRRLAKDEVTMRVGNGSKVDCDHTDFGTISHAHLHLVLSQSSFNP